GALAQHPRPGLLQKAEAEVSERASLCVRVNDLGLAYVLRSGVREIDLENGVDSQLGGASAQEPAETHVLGCHVLFNFVSVLVSASQLKRNTQSHSDFGSRDKAADFRELVKASAQGIEVNGLFEIGESSKLLAVLLCLSAGLAADDNHGDLLRVAEGCKGLKEFIAGIFRHAEVQQDSVGLVFESEGQT